MLDPHDDDVGRPSAFHELNGASYHVVALDCSSDHAVLEPLSPKPLVWPVSQGGHCWFLTLVR